jgi:hypothetical protein
MMLSSAMQSRSMLANVCMRGQMHDFCLLRVHMHIHTSSLIFHHLYFFPSHPSFRPSLAQADMSNFLIRLGYDVVAYNVSATAPLAKQHRCQIKACPAEGADTADKSSKKRSTVTAALRLDGKASFQQVRQLVPSLLFTVSQVSF